MLGNYQASPQNDQSTTTKSSRSSGRDQEQRRLKIEHELGLRRPDVENGEGSSRQPNASRSSARHTLRDDDEVPEAVEPAFPVQRSTRDTRSAAPGSGRRITGQSRRTDGVANSSPSRPLHRQDHINVSSSEEEQETIEVRPKSPQLLSPDPEPPKFPPRSTLTAPTPPALTKRAKMRKKDGSRPSESESSRRASFPPPKSPIASSNVSAIPAAIDWAVVESGKDKHVIHAQNISLRTAGPRKDVVLELVGGIGRRASLPLESVSGLQVSQHRATTLTLVQPQLVSTT